MTREEADLRLAAHRLSYAKNAIETSPLPLDDADTEYLEEIGALIDMIHERINGAVFADAWLMDARITAVFDAVIAKHRRGPVVVLPTRRPTPEPGPLGAA